MVQSKSIFKNHCEKCDYGCISNRDFNKHLQTQKHNAHKCSKMLKESPLLKCECGKEYKHIQSINRHKKTCNYYQHDNQNIPKKNTELNYKEMFLKMMTENKELKNIILFSNKEFQNNILLETKELKKQIQDLIPNIGNNNNNTTNQIFNINLFLNEHCKDAITMEEFINKIKISMSNLLTTKNKGIDHGITNIILENMNKLSLYERPIHCTDAKRETVYIKSDGQEGNQPKWEKDEDNVKLKKAIKTVESKQHKNLTKWTEEHPDWQSKSELQDEYMRLVRSCTSDVREKKVIKNICDNVKVGDKAS